MTPEAQRIAIAEFCGWVWHSPTGIWIPPNANELELPRYLNDLNAMHEAEKNLDTGLAKQFAWELHKVMPGQQSWPPRSPLHTYIILHATAAQRAKALLRTIGKWVESVTKQEKGEG